MPLPGYGLTPYGTGPYGDPTPGGLPTVHVLLDDGTGTFPYDITGYAMLADGFTLERGRQDWQGGVTAGTLALTLNNSDGRFTVGSTTIASPSPIKVDARIRVTETVDGSTFTRFTGYVKQWPVAWPATVSTFATVQVVATDAQARAERRVLVGVIDEEIAADKPREHYPLNEAAGATAAGDRSGNGGLSLRSMDTGTPVAFNGSVATFNGTHYLTAALAPCAAIECYFTTSTNDATSRPLLSTGPDAFVIQLQNGRLSYGFPSHDLGPVADGVRHHLMWNGTTIYLDAVAAYTGATSPLSILDVGGLAVGVTSGFIGTVEHVATYSSTLSPARVSAHHQAGSDFAGESGAARVSRVAGYAGLSVGTLDTSLTNVAGTDTTNQSAWDAIQAAVDAELGTVFVDGAGALRFHNRNKVAAKTAPDLVLDKAYVRGVQPVHDDQLLQNYIEATAAGTNVTQVARSASSETAHGRYSGSVSYLVQTDAEALDRANWIIVNFAEPSTRFGTLTIDLYAMTPRAAAAVLAVLEINCWLQITGLPSQTPGGTTVDLVVEGYSEHADEDSWSVTCNVVSRSLFDCLILDDPTRGVLESQYSRLYV